MTVAGAAAGIGPAPSLPTGELLHLAEALEQSSSGVSFIYHALDVVARHCGLADLVLVIDDTPIGRQVFRLRRDGTHASGTELGRRWFANALRGPAGLHGTPGAVDRAVSSYVTHLALMAVRMDLLAHDAAHDPLTGLLNRRSYEVALSEAIGRGHRYQERFALILFDLDDFKALNDELGHAAGDEALRTIGSELRATLRTGDVAARLGGDEFALIVLKVDSTEVLRVVESRFRAALDMSAVTTGIQFSSGLAAFPADGEEAVSLQLIADQRLYAHKARPR